MKWHNEKISKISKKLNIQILLVRVTKALYYLTSRLKSNFWIIVNIQV